MTNNHDSCECEARGWTLAFLLSNYACQYFILLKYNPDMCSDRKFSLSRCLANVVLKYLLVRCGFSYICYSLCTNCTL